MIVTINSNAADGRDPSWLWDVPFERLRGGWWSPLEIAVATSPCDCCMRKWITSLSRTLRARCGVARRDAGTRGG